MPPSKLNGRVAPYSPSCSHVCVVSSLSSVSARSQAVSTSSSSLPASLPSLLTQLAASPIAAPLTTGGLAVADTGATDHMLPDRSCFISYKSVVGLSVRMGNNSFVPVLGRGSAIFALNGKCILGRNVIHVPGLAVPLYSLRTHVTQRGCGFFGTQDSGFLVYFPSFLCSPLTQRWIVTYPSLHWALQPRSMLSTFCSRGARHLPIWSRLFQRYPTLLLLNSFQL